MSGIGGTLDGRILAVVNEIDASINNTEKWMGKATTPVGETHVADRMVGGIAPFTLTAGNDDFGAWVQILGTDDTPVTTGMVKVSVSRYMVISTSSTNQFNVQFVSGEFADIPARLATEDYTEAPYKSATNNADSGISGMLARVGDVGLKVWVRAVCIGSSGSTISIYYGIHEYEE